MLCSTGEWESNLTKTRTGEFHKGHYLTFVALLLSHLSHCHQCIFLCLPLLIRVSGYLPIGVGLRMAGQRGAPPNLISKLPPPRTYEIGMFEAAPSEGNVHSARTQRTGSDPTATDHSRPEWWEQIFDDKWKSSRLGMGQCFMHIKGLSHHDWSSLLWHLLFFLAVLFVFLIILLVRVSVNFLAMAVIIFIKRV